MAQKCSPKLKAKYYYVNFKYLNTFIMDAREVYNTIKYNFSK